MSVQVRSDELPLDAEVLDALAARLVDPLARRVVEVMKEEGVAVQAPVSHRWLDAAAVAERLGMTPANGSTSTRANSVRSESVADRVQGFASRPRWGGRSRATAAARELTRPDRPIGPRGA